VAQLYAANVEQPPVAGNGILVEAAPFTWPAAWGWRPFTRPI